MTSRSSGVHGEVGERAIRIDETLADVADAQLVDEVARGQAVETTEGAADVTGMYAGRGGEHGRQ